MTWGIRQNGCNSSVYGIRHEVHSFEQVSIDGKAKKSYDTIYMGMVTSQKITAYAGAKLIIMGGAHR
jgi:hypothetical protein